MLQSSVSLRYVIKCYVMFYERSWCITLIYELQSVTLHTLHLNNTRLAWRFSWALRFSELLLTKSFNCLIFLSVLKMFCGTLRNILWTFFNTVYRFNDNHPDLWISVCASWTLLILGNFWIQKCWVCPFFSYSENVLCNILWTFLDISR